MVHGSEPYANIKNWVDWRYLKTLARLIVRLIQDRAVRHTARTSNGQSGVRRSKRWFLNKPDSVHGLYGPLIYQSLTEWGQSVLSLVRVTPTLRDMYGRAFIV